MAPVHRKGPLAVGILLTLLFSCNPSVPHKTWARLDVDSALSAMWRPTGRLSWDWGDTGTPMDAYLNEYLPGIWKRVRFFTGTLELLARAAGTAPTGSDADGGDWLPDAGPIPADDNEVNSVGTYLFLDVACPGPDSYEAAKDFAFGRLRIDSDDLSNFDLRNLHSGVHMLLDFQGCQTPAGTIDETVAAYLMGGFSGLLVDLSPFGLALGEIKGLYLLSQRKGGSILIDTGETGTYRIDIDIGNYRQEVRLVTATGTILCHTDVYNEEIEGCALLAK